ncbi:MAG TPA: HD domain-containing phosphohydrolase [Solirubrobacterales bacterium]|nr:HD domain-containing phosphohydrolase [Solirubrobacterales bacterium]
MTPASSGHEKQDRAHLLVTDDRPEVRQMVERGLGERYDCEFTSSLEQAREKLAAGTFQVAICDLQTPQESGLVQVEEIARDYPETALVLITDVDDPEVTERTFRLGAHGYLVKPFWPGQLLITTKNALRQRELELALKAESWAVEGQLQLLSDVAPVPISIKDAERRYVLANRMAHEIAGLESGDLIGLTDKAFMSPEAERIAAESDREVLAGATFEKVETILVAGRERTFLNLKFPFVDESGKTSGITSISTDITSKRLAEALREELTTAEAEAIKDLRASRQETVERLALAIETHDEQTGRHVARMASITAYLGAKLGFDEDQVLLLRAAAPMHDVGKIATPAEILRKPGPLTPEERTVMERHTTFGHQILADSKSELLQMAAAIALTHHESWDGTGYPRGLEGEEIPLEGRVAAVADVFDALLSDRPYRPAMPVTAAVALVREGRGTQFDPRVADALLENVEEILAFRVAEPLDERRADGPPGKPAFDHEVFGYSGFETEESSEDLGVSQAVESASLRDAAAEQRDRAAEERDLAAQARDVVMVNGGPKPAKPSEASRDRSQAADDRRQAARDRKSASHELAYEGIDSLTGVMRRRVGLAAVQREMDRAERTGELLVLAFVDTVGLKAINDTQGHAAGDRVLQDLAGCLTDGLRSYDTVTRVGGDEFVCTHSGQTIAQAEARYEEISHRLAGRPSGARMRVGLAMRQKGDSLAELVDRADQEMIGSRRQ